jgi:hypothetical protein
MNTNKTFIISVASVSLIVMFMLVTAVAVRNREIASVSTSPDAASAASRGGQGAMIQQIMLNNANQYGGTVGQTETAEDDLNLSTMSVFTAQ